VTVARETPAITVHHLRLSGRDVQLLEGPAGWGECSPFSDYPCDPARAWAAAEEAACTGFPAARRGSVRLNALVPGPDVDAAALAGFDAVKVKMRSPDDVRLVARVRDVVGARVEVRVDANGVFDVETAVDVVAQLRSLDVALVEQPVATLDELAALRRRVSVPVAADESVRDVADARRLRELAAADAVVLKVQPLGGVRPALAVAEEAGVPAIPTSMMETSVGLAAGLALACSLPEVPLACGLATAALLDEDVTSEPLVPRDGWLVRRLVIPDPDRLDRYAAASPSSHAISS
jgi:O-succinylbenzoate synthase